MKKIEMLLRDPRGYFSQACWFMAVNLLCILALDPLNRNRNYDDSVLLVFCLSFILLAIISRSQFRNKAQSVLAMALSLVLIVTNHIILGIVGVLLLNIVTVLNLQESSELAEG